MRHDSINPGKRVFDPSESIEYREEVRPSDSDAVDAIIRSTGFFSPEEREVAVELVHERLSRGVKSGYYFVFAEQAGRTFGYTCFGPIPCTLCSYDLYWIAVHNDQRGLGIGRGLLEKSEELAVAQGAARMYIETSVRALYEPTRVFYRRCGYREEARLADFYAPGDDKLIYVKTLDSSR